MKTQRGFTLIELLIVVAIIGILAAIAIPNFLNAQIRARVARTQADMRELKNALFLYQTDHGAWPSDTYAGSDPCGPAPWSILYGLQELSTPIEYMSTVPYDDTFNSAAVAGGGGCPDISNHYQYWYDTFAVPPSDRNLGTIWDTEDWVIAAPGPAQVWPTGFNIGYDPSNGTVSRGMTWVSPKALFGDQ